jgi:ribosome-associated protein
MVRFYKQGNFNVKVREISIRGETIRLGQLLKLAGVIDSGSDAKAFLAAAPVWINGERDARRGRQLHFGDTVRIGESELRVIARDDSVRQKGESDTPGR